MDTKRSAALGLFLLLSLVGPFAKAGENAIFLGGKGGFTIPRLSSSSSHETELSRGFSSCFGQYMGFTAEYHFSQRLGMRMEVNYSGQGGNRNGMQAIPLPPALVYLKVPYLYADIKNKARLNYIEIPVMGRVTFSLSRKMRLYLLAGPYLGLLANAKNITSGTSHLYMDKNGTIPITPTLPLDQTTDILKDTRRVNTGIQAGAGLERNLGPGKIFAEGGGNYGFITIQKDPANGQNHTGAGVLAFGYMFRFGK
jgi:hypothetical protein